MVNSRFLAIKRNRKSICVLLSATNNKKLEVYSRTLGRAWKSCCFLFPSNNCLELLEEKTGSSLRFPFSYWALELARQGCCESEQGSQFLTILEVYFQSELNCSFYNIT